MNHSVSYKALYEIVDKFRKENNEGFLRMEKKLDDHSKKELIAFKDIDKRIKPLEKLADRALFFVLLLSGAMAAVWQIGSAWVKKQLNIT